MTAAIHSWNFRFMVKLASFQIDLIAANHYLYLDSFLSSEDWVSKYF
jgi:cytochrome bd-type quinol oxidase subunit 1